jgi:hypothetical protein
VLSQHSFPATFTRDSAASSQICNKFATEFRVPHEASAAPTISMHYPLCSAVGAAVFRVGAMTDKQVIGLAWALGMSAVGLMAFGILWPLH